MTNERALFRFNQERHRDVRLIPGIDLSAFHKVNHAKIGLHEVTHAAADYPLVFLKDADSGQFRLVALFGIEPGVNSFLNDDFWQAVYLPQAVIAAPFQLDEQDKALIINEASTLVTTVTGNALFSADGCETSTLQQICVTLAELDQGQTEAAQLIECLLTFGLIWPIAVTAHLVSGQKNLVQGLYSISPILLREIGPDALMDLHGRDYLGPIYTMIQSLTQFNRIRQLHNLQSSQQISGLDIVMEQH